jgi:hypothetical protein
MSQKDNIFTAKLVKRDGKLVHVNQATIGLQTDFVDALEEGQEIEVFFEANKDDGTHAQLAKVHVMIRKLAQDMGYTFEEMKKEIKRRSGLAYGDLQTSEGYVKSFADCSKEELGLVIEEINSIALKMGLSL